MDLKEGQARCQPMKSLAEVGRHTIDLGGYQERVERRSWCRVEVEGRGGGSLVVVGKSTSVRVIWGRPVWGRICAVLSTKIRLEADRSLLVDALERIRSWRRCLLRMKHSD